MVRDFRAVPVLELEIQTGSFGIMDYCKIDLIVL